MTGLAGWVASFVLMLVALFFAALFGAAIEDASDVAGFSGSVSLALATLAILVRPRARDPWRS